MANSTRELSEIPGDATALMVTFLPEEDLRKLERLSRLNALYFGGWSNPQWNEWPALTDSGLEQLVKLELPELRSLFLGPNQAITDVGLRHLMRLQNLKNLSLAACTAVTDDGLSALTALTRLEGLDLRGNSQLSDQGVIRLERMTNLKMLFLDGCRDVTPEAVARLRRALTNCRVTKDDALWRHQMRSAWNNRVPFWQHANPGVRYPALFGAGVGMVVGVPVAILAFPFMAAFSDSNLGPIAPWFICIAGGSMVFGGITWPLFGWWPPVTPDEGVRRGNHLNSGG